MHYGVHTQCCRAGRGGCSRAVSPSHPAGSRAELSHPLGRPPGTQRCPRGAISPGQLCAPQALGAARCEGDAAPRPPPQSTVLAVPAAPHSARPAAPGDARRLRSRGPPVCQQHRTAMQHRRALQPHGAHVGAAACDAPTCRCAQLSSQPACTQCCTSPLRVAGTLPHIAPHGGTLNPEPPPPPTPRATPHVPNPTSQGCWEQESRKASGELEASRFWILVPVSAPGCFHGNWRRTWENKVRVCTGALRQRLPPPAGGHTHTPCFGDTARSDIPHAPTSGAQIAAGVGDTQCHAPLGGLAVRCCGQWHREAAVTPPSRLPSSPSFPSPGSALRRTSQQRGGAGSRPTPRTPTCSHRPRSPTWAFPAPPELPISGPPFWHRGRVAGSRSGERTRTRHPRGALQPNEWRLLKSTLSEKCRSRN